MLEALLDTLPRARRSSTLRSLPPLFTVSAKASRALGGALAAVEQDVLDPLQQVLRDLLVDLELTGVDDPHVHAGLDGVVEEGGVHGLAHRVVAAEGEGQVRHAAR